MGRARTRKILWRVCRADSTFLCEPLALGTAGGYRCVPPGFPELRMRWFAACRESVRTMTVSVRDPSCRWKCFRYMQIRLGLHWPVETFRSDRGVGFLCTQQCFWAITPTAYRGITGTAKSPTPKGA